MLSVDWINNVPVGGWSDALTYEYYLTFLVDDAAWGSSETFYEWFRSVIWRLNSVAKKRSAGTRSGSLEASKPEWVNVSLTADDQQAALEWTRLNVGDLLGHMCNLAENGVSFSFKQRPDGDYMCAAYWSRSGNQGRGSWALSAFSPQPEYAIAGLLFKYIVLLNGGTELDSSDDAGKHLFR